jgi:hypothetical protein
LFSANVLLFAGGSQVIAEVLFSSNEKVYVARPGQQYLFETPFTLGGYHTLEARMDFTNRVTTFLVNGSVIGSLGFGSTTTSPVFSRMDVAAFAYLPPIVDSSRYTAYFDNYSVQAVPEPSVLALACLGGFGLFGVVKRGYARR